jgi:hypothetical protein
LPSVILRPRSASRRPTARVFGRDLGPVSGRVYDFETDLSGIAEAYAAMDERRAIKSLVRIGAI